MTDANFTYLVRINYKSGASFEGWFDEFELNHEASDVTSVRWKLSDNQQNIPFMGTNSIESVVQLGFKAKKDNDLLPV